MLGGTLLGVAVLTEERVEEVVLHGDTGDGDGLNIISDLEKFGSLW